ncbi:MAG: TIGR01906 family membrane protein [Streptococcaceae bacterium]|nr:TIGR01906 family membrane protein [Streptococcaceae bacterium]
MRDKVLFGLTILWSIAASVVVTVLLSVPLFWLDSRAENLTEISGLGSTQLFHNYRVLINYSMNPFVTQLKMPDFPDSPSALTHFAEVKSLFLIALALALVLLIATVKFLREHLHIFFRRGILVVLAVPVVLTGIAATVGFDTFFIGFHKVLFRDNTWLFDPTTDPIINVLTDNFFMWTFVIFGTLYLLFWGILWMKGHVKHGRTV